jgi:4-alpha-glucanotransferase
MEEHAAEVAFWRFVQYEFHREWTALRAHATRNAVGLFGDMPLYVSENSADVWGRSEVFELGKDLRPSCVAGVPPDYFAANGQRWGQPLYDWKRLASDGYDWWIGRVRHALSLYDAVRIDHFRGFAAYWSIPAEAPDARSGQWIQGPGAAFFRALEKALGPVPIVAEDLGDIDDAVRRLLVATGFPGMKVLQFAFLDDSDSTHLPHNHVRNAIAYTGTHDNDTTLGWLYAMSAEERTRVTEYCGLPLEEWGRGGADSPALRQLFRTLWASPAVLAVVPMQDLLGFGSDTRMNTPATGTGNWRFRFTRENLEDFTRVSAPFLRDLGRIYRR